MIIIVIMFCQTWPIKPVRNLNGHSIGPYQIHGGKSAARLQPQGIVLASGFWGCGFRVEVGFPCFGGPFALFSLGPPY